MSPHSIKIKVVISTSGDYHAPKHVHMLGSVHNDCSNCLINHNLCLLPFRKQPSVLFCYQDINIAWLPRRPGGFEIPVLL